jgi:hypothetical protein
MKLPRVQFTLRRLMVAIALTTVLTYLVVIPAWDYYHLTPKTRLILRKLRMPVSLPINGPMTLEEFLKAIKTASAEPKDSGIPLYVEPNGLSRSVRRCSQRSRSRPTVGPSRSNWNGHSQLWGSITSLRTG